ncbi:MAG: hypothetical protein HUJ68_06485 [Clostridia bacterium]|nr:hypothetical protein [Clostridia bacterium]
MANKNKKKTKSQIRAERVAAANKARETMIANAIAEYEAKKKAQRKRKRALAAKKHHHKSQPKQTTQVTTTVVQQSSNVQNTAGVNKFFVERTLSCSKKTKVNSIVSFILSLAVILTGFALALIVFLSFVKNVSDEESLSQ